MNESIILVEDDKIMRVTLTDALIAAGYRVRAYSAGLEAIGEIESTEFDLMVTDVRLPDTDGFEILKRATAARTAPCIVMTAYGTIEDAVGAMKLGAFDYITKPFDIDEFIILVERALGHKRLVEENTRLKRDITRYLGGADIVGESQAVKKLHSLIDKVAPSDATVLILGESGVGKELVATAIHYSSPRKGGPLVKVNCAALPEGIIESELFGHEKGAFTGAIKRKPGRFELAHGGTIFLDEIGDLPPGTQAKILRTIQEHQFERVGGTATIDFDARIIAATNRDLEAEVRAGRFREDLFYRLNVIPVTVPPLRERSEDIPLLIEHFVERFSAKLGRPVKFSREAIEALTLYRFPGNIRELMNIVERCATLAHGPTIEVADLPSEVTGGESAPKLPSLSEVASDAERSHIVRVLSMTGGGKTRTAELLGISRKTLWEKINSYCID